MVIQIIGNRAGYVTNVRNGRVAQQAAVHIDLFLLPGPGVEEEGDAKSRYCNPCTVIFDGQRMEAPPLEQWELLLIDGVQYESFNTSGGLGSLAATLDGKVRNLSYQSIRYPGHAAIMRTLLRDLGLSNRRELLLDIFAHSLPVTRQDVVIIFITVSGLRGGRLEQVAYTNKILGRAINGREYTAIQLCTASSACAVLDLLASGRIMKPGFVRQEDIELACVLVDPIPHRVGLIPAQPEFLGMLRRWTRSNGTLLLFDEVVTFRTSVGGAQGRYGVCPDLTALGKLIGAGTGTLSTPMTDFTVDAFVDRCLGVFRRLQGSGNAGTRGASVPDRS